MDHAEHFFDPVRRVPQKGFSHPKSYDSFPAGILDWEAPTYSLIFAFERSATIDRAYRLGSRYFWATR